MKMLSRNVLMIVAPMNLYTILSTITIVATTRIPAPTPSDAFQFFGGRRRQRQRRHGKSCFSHANVNLCHGRCKPKSSFQWPLHVEMKVEGEYYTVEVLAEEEEILMSSIQDKNNDDDDDDDDDDDVNSTHNALPILSPRAQNYIRDSGILRTIVNVATRTIAAPAFYYDYPHLFPEFIRISEYPHWLAMATKQIMYRTFNITDPYNTYSYAYHYHGDEDFSFNNNNNDDNDEMKIHFQKERYGCASSRSHWHTHTHPDQKADVMVPEHLQHDKDIPVMMFLHGGAWGSGFPTMYRLISSPFLKRGYRCIVLGYRTYPDSNIDDQVQDLTDAVEYFRKKYVDVDTDVDTNVDSGTNNKKAKMVLIGHSSGAHIAMMAALRGYFHSSSSNIIDGIICMSGVYDLEMARESELKSGLSNLSPMCPVCNIGEDNNNNNGDDGDDDDNDKASTALLRKNSPTWLLKSDDDDHHHHPRRNRKSTKEALHSILPPLLLLHGEDDTVTSPMQSKLLHDILVDQQKSPRSSLPLQKYQLEIMEGFQHQDLVIDTCVGYGRTQKSIFRWLDENGIV